MSIQDSIKGHLGKELFVLESDFLGRETPRTVFYSKEVSEVVSGVDRVSHDGMLFERAKASLDAFIELGRVTMASDPHNKKSSAIMAPVDSLDSGVFDFRVTDPKPGLRILGCFAAPDEFVALTYDYRENFDDEWPAQLARCQAEWTRLFGDIEPFKGRLDEYVTYNSQVI